jgi:hypothetical protein
MLIAEGHDRACRIPVRIIADQRDAFDAFGANLARNGVSGQPAFMGLSARHRNGVIVEDLVGNVGAEAMANRNASTPEWL